jgi:hypothetical protein
MFNFVINYPDNRLSDFIRIESLADFAINNTEAASEIFAEGELAWCLQTYLNLRNSGKLDVRCSNQLSENHINLVHSNTLLNVKGGANHFIVCVRADFPKRHWAHYQIVQNTDQLESNTSYIPHWVQPGLLKRDPNRRGVQRVAYAGQTFNNNLAGSEESWKRLLDPYGIEFKVLSNQSWHDLSSIDVLIGIRSFDTRPWKTKPPSKLFNAWHAGIPFIGGFDSAFKQVGNPGKDYLRVKSQQEAVSSILKLRDDADLYNRMVEQGYQMAGQYTTETITKQWESILTNQVLQRYQSWKSTRWPERLRFTLIQHSCLFEHGSRQLLKRLIGLEKKK